MTWQWFVTVVLSSFMSPTHKMGLCCYTAQLYTRPIDSNCSQIQQPFSSPLWPYFSLCETIFCQFCTIYESEHPTSCRTTPDSLPRQWNHEVFFDKDHHIARSLQIYCVLIFVFAQNLFLVLWFERHQAQSDCPPPLLHQANIANMAETDLNLFKHLLSVFGSGKKCEMMM